MRRLYKTQMMAEHYPGLESLSSNESCQNRQKAKLGAWATSWEFAVVPKEPMMFIHYNGGYSANMADAKPPLPGKSNMEKSFVHNIDEVLPENRLQQCHHPQLPGQLVLYLQHQQHFSYLPQRPGPLVLYQQLQPTTTTTRQAFGTILFGLLQL